MVPPMSFVGVKCITLMEISAVVDDDTSDDIGRGEGLSATDNFIYSTIRVHTQHITSSSVLTASSY